MKASLFSYIAEVVIIIALMVSIWLTATSVDRKNISRAYLYGGITAALGLLEVVLVSINCL